MSALYCCANQALGGRPDPTQNGISGFDRLNGWSCRDDRRGSSGLRPLSIVDVWYP